MAGLARNEAGNALLITAAAIIPLIAIIGSAVDISRAYLVKSRLQQACDAGALAGRREMANGAWTQTAEDTALNFFRTNFANHSYGTGDTAVSFDEDDDQVVGTASVPVPMVMMQFFGMGSRTMSVSCTSVMKIPNTDVMFVLDNTGSMANKAKTSDSQTKIAALRSAVLAFYDALESAKGANTQIRYGFVPYSVNVNVGSLLQRGWVSDKAKYQSRKPKFTGSYTTVSSDPVKVSGSKSTGSAYDNNSCPSNSYASSTYSETTKSTTASPFDASATITVKEVQTKETGDSYSCTKKNNKYSVTKTSYTNYITKQTVTIYPVWTWIYDQIEYDVSGLKGNNGDGTMKTGTTLTAPIGAFDSTTGQPSNIPVTWTGCIEERKTLQATDYDKVPTGELFDLDIDKLPKSDDEDTRWKPALSTLVFGRSNTSSSGSSWSTSSVTSTSNYYTPSTACPTAAQRLGTIDRGNLVTYLDSLVATGNTYHDIGMIWGARLISPEGLFAADNAQTGNGGAIARHIVFMTDGATEPSASQYTPYGLEPLDRRRTKANSAPSSSDITKVVNARLAYLCSAIKAKNITVWVVAFGTDLTTNLSTCASPNKAFQANSASELNDAFTNIAAQISQLRLTN